jgi:hypothetical protein
VRVDAERRRDLAERIQFRIRPPILDFADEALMAVADFRR